MLINGYLKTYIIYCIKCNITNKVYIGSTSNLTARINTHLSSFKTNTSKCSSRFVLSNNNYQISVLVDKIVSKGTHALPGTSAHLPFGFGTVIRFWYGHFSFLVRSFSSFW